MFVGFLPIVPFSSLIWACTNGSWGWTPCSADRPWRGGLADCNTTSSICCCSDLFFDLTSVISFSSDSTYSIKRCCSQMLLQWSVKTDATPPKEKQKRDQTNETLYTVYGQKTMLCRMLKLFWSQKTLEMDSFDNESFHILLVSLCGSKTAITYSQLFNRKMTQPWQH